MTLGLIPPWKTLSSKQVLKIADGRFLSVDSHEIELPNGRRIADWPIINVPDYVIVAAFTTLHQLLAFKQRKYAIPDVTRALVGGYIEPGEDPIQAAQRELLEETGYATPNWEPLGCYVVDANRGAGNAHLFLATEAEPQSQPTERDLEQQHLELLSLECATSAMNAGEFKALAWTTALALALPKLKATG